MHDHASSHIALIKVRIICVNHFYFYRRKYKKMREGFIKAQARYKARLQEKEYAKVSSEC